MSEARFGVLGTAFFQSEREPVSVAGAPLELPSLLAIQLCDKHLRRAPTLLRRLPHAMGVGLLVHARARSLCGRAGAGAHYV